MKKIFLMAAVFAAFAMSSCSKSAADYAKEGTELSQEAIKLMQEGKYEEAQKVGEKLQALEKEVKEKAAADPEFEKELNKALEEQAKAEYGE